VRSKFDDDDGEMEFASLFLSLMFPPSTHRLTSGLSFVGL